MKNTAEPDSILPRSHIWLAAAPVQMSVPPLDRRLSLALAAHVGSDGSDHVASCKTTLIPSWQNLSATAFVNGSAD